VTYVVTAGLAGFVITTAGAIPTFTTVLCSVFEPKEFEHWNVIVFELGAAASATGVVVAVPAFCVIVTPVFVFFTRHVAPAGTVLTPPTW
jgi:hypothetical protein